jgi:hypothetical protein
MFEIRLTFFVKIMLPIFALGISSAQAQLDQSTDLKKTFFAGAFFDPYVSKQSQLIQYLVTPQIADGAEPEGNELSILAREALKHETRFLQATKLRLSGSTDGNPIAIYVSRAQHQTFVQTAGDLSVHYTWISVTVNLDILTDEAAFENSKRFESIYSQLQMVNQPIRTQSSLSRSRLEREYAELFTQAVREIARRSAEDLEWSRSRADAVYQIAKFIPPRKPSVGYSSLLESAIASQGLTVTDESKKREQTRLQRELMHSMNTLIAARLREKNINNLAMMPPESPWGDSKIIKLLEDRKGMSFMAGNVLSKIDVSTMEGFRIYGLWAGEGIQELERNNSQALMLYVPLIAGAVYGVDTKGKLTGSRPLCLKDKKARKPIGRRGIQYREVVGLPMNRVIFIQAFRASTEVLAERLVELMVLTAGELSGETSDCHLPQPPGVSAPATTQEVGIETEEEMNR